MDPKPSEELLERASAWLRTQPYRPPDVELAYFARAEVEKAVRALAHERRFTLDELNAAAESAVEKATRDCRERIADLIEVLDDEPWEPGRHEEWDAMHDAIEAARKLLAQHTGSGEEG